MAGRVLDAADIAQARDEEFALSSDVVGSVRRLIGGLDPRTQAVLHLGVVGGDVDAASVAAVLELDEAEARTALAAARSTGLLLPDGRPLPVVVRALADEPAGAATMVLTTRLLHARYRQGRGVVPLARALARLGTADPLAAEVLVGEADRLRSTDPASAAVLYGEAVEAGAAPGPLAMRRAQCAARCGHYGGVLELLEDVLARPEHADLPEAVDLGAVAWSHEGHLDRARDLYRWLGAQRVGSSASLAAVVALAAGHRLEANEALAAESVAATSAGAVRSLMARGLAESLERDGRRGLSLLMQATAINEIDGQDPLLAESPTVAAALLAIHLGDLDVAQSALAGATDDECGAAVTRQRLLLAWVAMLRGQYARANELLQRATNHGSLSLRDGLFARALRVGMARRTSNVGGLIAAWRDGWDVLLRHPVDLFTLLPTGEFVVAAARLREFDRVEPRLEEAFCLLSDLGEPAAWSPTLRWCALQAAILRNRPDQVEPHAVALVRAAPVSDLAAALAAAGRAWTQVLTTRFETADVEQAARRLQEFGLAWDGSRLLGQAAAHTADRRRIAYLLHAARTLQEPDDGIGPVEAPGTSKQASSAVLSAREQEIAALVLQQRTYRDIGRELFISPKTVEHHVARIKQRLGASDRADLLARLRATTVSG